MLTFNPAISPNKPAADCKRATDETELGKLMKKAASSSSPILPASPFVAAGPLRSTTSSPALVHLPSHLYPPNPMADIHPSHAEIHPTLLLFPIISPSNTAISKQSQRPSHLTIMPSSEFLVPSPQNSSLPSLNIFAYYNIPLPHPLPHCPWVLYPASQLLVNAFSGDC